MDIKPTGDKTVKNLNTLTYDHQEEKHSIRFNYEAQTRDHKKVIFFLYNKGKITI